MQVNVSVLITCHNKEAYLDECVSSVIRQTKSPKEIIVVHDECENPMHHAKVTSIMLPTNLGVCKARDVAFRYSTGELILFLDGDDIMSPDYIEKMVLKIADGADIAYPDIYFFGDPGESLTISPEPLQLSLIAEMKKLPIVVTSMMKREVYSSLGGFSNFPVLEDMDFWLRAMCNGYTFKKAQTLLWYRQEGVKRNAIDEGKKNLIIADIFSQFTITSDSIKKNETN